MVSLILMDRGAKVIGTKTQQGLNPGRFHYNMYGIIWRGWMDTCKKYNTLVKGITKDKKIERGMLPQKEHIT